MRGTVNASRSGFLGAQEVVMGLILCHRSSGGPGPRLHFHCLESGRFSQSAAVGVSEFPSLRAGSVLSVPRERDEFSTFAPSPSVAPAV